MARWCLHIHRLAAQLKSETHTNTYTHKVTLKGTSEGCQVIKMASVFEIALANKTSHMKVPVVHLAATCIYYRQQEIEYEWNHADTAGCKSSS